MLEDKEEEIQLVISYIKGFYQHLIFKLPKQRIREIAENAIEKGLPYDGLGITITIWSVLTQEEHDLMQYVYDNSFTEKFIVPHKQTYAQALQEVKNGRKETQWMWWIFPQMKELDNSVHSQMYRIPHREMAEKYLHHPILGQHLREITQAVLDSDKTPYEIFGNDVVKFRSCMLLFATLEQEQSENVFKKVLAKNHWL